MTNGRYSSRQTKNNLVTVLLVLLILFMVATAFLLGFLIGQRNCNFHSHTIPEATQQPITAPVPLPQTQPSTEPVEKNDGKSPYPALNGWTCRPM